MKSEASIRTIPVHPALLELGLLHRVEALRMAGETRLFPKVKLGGVNGPGNWLSKAFSRHVEALVGKPEKGKFGFMMSGPRCGVTFAAENSATKLSEP
ncbi:hypothetical protein [Dyella sp. GSA-30]|uniref:hypothetical protein n=1 Tax=Dyella sp. GSA-30 TaxID=2994496 RepID=UPI00248F63B5|nr:hypothetical protein [Dyella sp. GSA-30]